jgi:predicted AAA+ superfamily ATPase
MAKLANIVKYLRLAAEKMVHFLDDVALTRLPTLVTHMG